MIRDFRTRARSASDTLKNWPGVAQGEEKYIFPFIDSADLIWNSSLEYEVSILYPFVFFTSGSDHCESQYCECTRFHGRNTGLPAR